MRIGRGKARSGVLAVAAVAAVFIVQLPAPAATTPPDSEVNVVGDPFTGTTPSGGVRGFFDGHTHLFGNENLGGRFICGDVFSSGGAPSALVDCPDHFPLGIPAVGENLLKTGLPIGIHDTTGWPTFRDWPAWNSLTHQMMYYKWIERAWRSGLRIMVNHLVANRVLCEIWPYKENPCDEMATIRIQAQRTLDLQAYIDAQNGGAGKGWFRVVYSAEEARQVIEAGKLAVILGIEASEPFGCRSLLGAAQCTAADIDAGLDEMYALGVRSMHVCHKFDNALCGVRFDSGIQGVIVNAGNVASTGKFFQADHCDGPLTDNAIEPGGLDLLVGPLAALRPIGVTLPVYPSPPHCNVLGLTDLGAHMVEGMMQRGMIVELDHMSVKAAGQTLDILEANGYSGVISAHSWMDYDYLPRVYALGGVVSPYGNRADQYVAEWREARAASDPSYTFGLGFGIDANGLGNQAAPRAGSGVTYPFTSFDGGSTIYPQRTGQRVWNYNVSGRPHYGLIPDWLEDARKVAGADGPQFVADLLNGAEAYLQMWERASA